MCEKDIQELEDSAEIEKATISYLKKNEKNIINIFMKIVLEKNKIYLSEFQNDKRIQKEFRKSLKQHFKWIKEHCNDDETHLNDFRNNDTDEHYQVYCDFYKYAKKYVKEDKKIYKQIRVELRDKYFNHLKNIYCSN